MVASALVFRQANLGLPAKRCTNEVFLYGRLKAYFQEIWKTAVECASQMRFLTSPLHFVIPWRWHLSAPSSVRRDFPSNVMSAGNSLRLSASPRARVIPGLETPFPFVSLA